jgi:mannose-6-phosphate isomerase-like protein (cupin superfamily)
MNARGHDAALDALVAGTRSVEEVARDVGAGIGTLPALAGYLTGDLPIEALERVEALLKSILYAACQREATGAEARSIALFQKQVGFLLKYKPYAVKCANPLGYSLFLQNAGEGFSFQRHTEHKVEVFHIVDVLPGGYAFLCDYSDWEEAYEPDSFARWLQGRADERYDRYRYELSPGDVLVIDQLNVVHTILGCVVEEFATVSTDMVDRLHDQNSRAHIPARFDREFARARLTEVPYPRESRVIYGSERGAIRPEPVAGGTMRVLADSFVGARAYSIDAHETGPALHDPERAASVYVTGGSGEFVLEDTAPIPVAAGDLLTILPGIRYQTTNRGDEPLTFSEHRIAPEVAFLPDAT